MKTQKTLSGLVALVGLWELIAAFTLGYSSSTAALWNAILVGIALVVLGAWAAVSNEEATDRSLDWVNFALGIWLIIAPFILGYRSVTVAITNDVIAGIIVVVLAGWAVLDMGRQHPMAK
jgi:hypothetical protein